MKTKNLTAHCMMFLWAIFIATSFPMAKLISPSMNSASLTSLRFLWAAVLFLPFLLLKKELKLPSKSEFFYYTVLSLFLVSYFWGMFTALKTTTSLNTGILFTLVPGLTAIMSYLIMRESISKQVLLALIAGLVGAVWVIMQGSLDRFLNMALARGDLIFLAGCVGLAFYGAMNKFFRVRNPIPRSAVYITFWIMLIGGICMLALALLELDFKLDWPSMTSQDIWATFYLTVFATCITFWQVQYCIPLLGPTTVMSYSYLTPSLVLGINYLVFSNTIPLNVIPGICLSLLALLAMTPLAVNFRQWRFRKWDTKNSALRKPI